MSIALFWIAQPKQKKNIFLATLLEWLHIFNQCRVFFRNWLQFIRFFLYFKYCIDLRFLSYN